MSYQHRLDRRSALLASKITHYINVVAEMLRPPGGMPPWTDQLTNEDALAFWRKHRFSPLGGQILAGWTPTQVATLDGWLSRNPDPSVAEGIAVETAGP